MSEQRTAALPMKVQVLVAMAFFPILLIAMSVLSGGFSMPAFFAAGAGVALTVALGLFWHSLRGALSAEGEVALAASDMLPERAALLEEKKTLLRAIKDISYEREVGKISEEDFARLDAAYRRRAREVLRALDADLEPYMERAEALARKAAGQAKAGSAKKTRRKKPNGEAPRKKRRRERKPAPSEDESLNAESSEQETLDAPPLPETVQCPSCDTTNDADARHCKGCGVALGPRECPECETENDADARFCKGCGATVGEASEARAAAGASSGSARPKKRGKKAKRGDASAPAAVSADAPAAVPAAGREEEE